MNKYILPIAYRHSTTCIDEGKNPQLNNNEPEWQVINENAHVPILPTGKNAQTDTENCNKQIKR